ncbi:uncharacterized protein [Haliotis asinina]|uniref:uncharacterized protein n=1 Tax=Haliotis asinina TaxID=109174 RepID=UPI003531AC06
MASSKSVNSEVIADVESVEDQLKSVSIRESDESGNGVRDVPGKSQLNASVRPGKDSSDVLMSDVVDDGSTSNSETASLHGHTTPLHGTEENNLDLHAKGVNPIGRSGDTNIAVVECKGNNNICVMDGPQPYIVAEEKLDDPSTISTASEEKNAGVDVEEGSCQQSEDSVRVQAKEKSEDNSVVDGIITDIITTDQVPESDGATRDKSAQLDLQSSGETCSGKDNVIKVDITSSVEPLPADVGHGAKLEESFGAESVCGEGEDKSSKSDKEGAESAYDEDQVKSSTRDEESAESACDDGQVKSSARDEESAESAYDEDQVKSSTRDEESAESAYDDGQVKSSTRDEESAESACDDGQVKSSARDEESAESVCDEGQVKSSTRDEESAESVCDEGQVKSSTRDEESAESACDEDQVKSSTRDAEGRKLKGDISAMTGTEMKSESENQSISDSQQSVSVPDTGEVSGSCDTMTDGTRIIPDAEDTTKEHLKDNTTELKQTKSFNDDQINRIESTKPIQSGILEQFTSEMLSEDSHSAYGEGELEGASACANSGDARQKSVSDVRSVSPGKSVRKRLGRGSRNPPGMGYSSLLRKAAEKGGDWKVGGEVEEQGVEENTAGITRQEKKNRRKKRRQNKDFPLIDVADEELVEQLQDFDDGSVDEDPGDMRQRSGRTKRDKKQFNRQDRQERRREEDILVEQAMTYFKNEWDDVNNSRSVYYDITGMPGQFMDDVDDDDDDDDNDKGNRLRNKRRSRGRGRGQIYDEGSRRGGRGRGRAREFRRTRNDTSDSSSHSGQKPEAYSTQDIRRSHSSVSESSNQSLRVLEGGGSFENVPDKGYINLTITASGDGTRRVETDCYSSFVNSKGSGGRRQDKKKKMIKKGSYANQTRDDERFQDVDDKDAQYRGYPEGQVMEGHLEEVPLKKKDKRKKKKKKDSGGERESNYLYAKDSSRFVEGGLFDQNQEYDQDATCHDSQELKPSRNQKKKQRYQRQLEGRSKAGEDYGYSGSFHEYGEPMDDPKGQIAAQQLPQKVKRPHIEESDRGLPDLDRGVAPPPQGRSHQGPANTRGGSRGRGGDSRRGRRGSRNDSGSYEHRHYSGDGSSQGRNDRYEPSHRSMSPRSNQGHHGQGNEFSGQHFQGKDYHSQQYQGHSRRGQARRRNHGNSHASAMTGHTPSSRMGQNVQQLDNENQDNRNRSHLGQGQNRTGTSVEGQQTSEVRQGQKDRRKWTKKTKQAKFEPHLSKEEVADGLKRGTLIEGPIRVNQKNFSEAYVPLPDGTADIYISGLHNRNRALNGDIVAVQLLDKQEWKVYVDDLQSMEAKVKPHQGQGEGDVTGGDDSDSGPDVIVEEVVQTNKGAKDSNNRKKKDSTPRKTYTSLKEVMTQGSPVAKALMGGAGDQGDAVDRDKLLQKTGKVVAVIEAKHSRVCSGHIKVMQDRNREVALFSPSDSRVPRIQVPMSDCPKDFYERPDDHAKTLFIARITEWDNPMFAKGHLSRSLGEAGQIEPETEAILLEHNVESDDFPEEVLTCLPATPWVIPESEFEYRKDLRRQCVFTIDPATARDLDDAVSIEELENGCLKVGVHIADVSFFLEEGTPLDIKAASRATSVYLVQKVVPMLPRLLCEELCSLNPDEDKLTFSVIWTMDANGEIEDEWFGRTVIKSCVKLSYDHAQGFIENPDREWSQEELPPITNGFVVEDIQKRVLQLDKIAKCLRKKRFDSGALRLDQVKLTFALDKETGMPNGYSVYEQKDSNRLIEEFMLLANMAVAHKIYKSYPEKAVLRRHPPPQSKMVDDLKDLCEQLGLAVDLSNSQTWQQSLSSYQGTDEFSAARMQVLVALSSKPMQNAKYFCSGMIADPAVYHHYALNVPLYTHFTSPIRRYADVMVHRLLASSLRYCQETRKDHRLLHKQADHCNDKKYMSKRVQEMSSDMFFAAFVKEVGPFEEKAMVMGVMDHSFDVFILKFGVSKRIYCDQLPLQDKTYIRDHKQPILTLVWESDEDHPEATQQTLRIFTSVTIYMMGDKDPLKWKAVLKRPTVRC